jgi:biopolymer transport protein ExbD
MFAVAAVEPAPMMEMNTTPLIDVMLVLLVMMIITIPPQSHAVKIDLPSIGVPIANPVRNLLVVTESGQALWNGEAVTNGQLRAVLGATAAMEPAPELHFQPDAKARYARVDEVLAMSKQAGVTKMGFVGNDAYMKAF